MASLRFAILVKAYLDSKELPHSIDELDCFDCALAFDGNLLADMPRLADTARDFVHAYATEDTSQLIVSLHHHLEAWIHN